MEVINCLPNIVLDYERAEEEMNKNKNLPAYAECLHIVIDTESISVADLLNKRYIF